jgi:TonB family protein
MLSSNQILRSSPVVACLACLICAAGFRLQQTATLSDHNLRQLATSKPMPDYPKASIAAKATGVAVTSIQVDLEGKVQAAEVLQAPDDAIREAVLSAIRRWTFGPLVSAPGATDRKRVQGKLVFYFWIKAGVPSVLDADQAAGSTLPGPTGGMTAVMPNVVGGASVKEISEAELQQLMTTKSVVVDVRDRRAFTAGHRAGSINIPIDELPARAGAELSGAPHVVIDCSENTPTDCRMAAAIIQHQGIPDVVLFVK